MTTRYCKRVGFTLIELLVVISIISLLVSILLPALAAARSAARSSKCMTNVKSQAMAIHLYASDYKDYAPPYFIRRGSGAWPGPEGYSGVDAFLSDKILLGQYTENEMTDSGYQTKFGVYKTGSVWGCPDFPNGIATSQSHYSASSSVFASVDSGRLWGYMWRVSNVKIPSILPALADASAAGFHPGYGGEFYMITDDGAYAYGTYSISSPNYKNNLRKRHHIRTTANISFLDGHVANFKNPREDYLAGRIDIKSPK